MLIAMAGLPATGKTTLALRLSQEVGAVVLSKDAVRAALFPPPVLDYSTEEDDLSMAAIYRAAAFILRRSPEMAVILDGRTFLRAYQVRDLLALAESVQEVPSVIECVCSDEVARKRLEEDRAGSRHPAGNRTFALYEALKANGEPIPLPRLVIETDRLPLEECVHRCMGYLCGAMPAELRSSGARRHE
jgi:predicted kinase